MVLHLRIVQEGREFDLESGLHSVLSPPSLRGPRCGVSVPARSLSGQYGTRRAARSPGLEAWSSFGHERNFRPIFLVNDILRYWKTLCLNYENKRNIRSSDPAVKNKNHLRNLKLKFSRLLTCYSAVIPLCARRSATREDILHLIRKSPIERIQSVSRESSKNRGLLDNILSEYAWFLEVTAKPDIISWIGNPMNRDTAFGRARTFGSQMFRLLDCSCSGDILRYLVI